MSTDRTCPFREIAAAVRFAAAPPQGTTVERAQAKTNATKCIGDRCAWYDGDPSCCTIPVAAFVALNAARGGAP